MDGYFWLVVLAAVAGLVPAAIAGRKGRSFGKWWVLGTFLWLPALITVLVVSNKRKEQTTMSSDRLSEISTGYGLQRTMGSHGQSVEQHQDVLPARDS